MNISETKVTLYILPRNVAFTVPPPPLVLLLIVHRRWSIETTLSLLCVVLVHCPAENTFVIVFCFSYFNEIPHPMFFIL
jgi:hypothetical protein